MQKVFALLCHGVILAAALCRTSSTSGFLLTGLGLTLLLDKYAWRLLPWPPVVWKKELASRAGSFLGGAVAFYCLRLGLVPLWEAAYRGFMVCLAALLLEWLVSQVHPLRTDWRDRLRFMALLMALLVVLLPVVAALHPLHTVPKRTPAAFGLAFEEVRLQTADGLELAAWFVPHTHARGTLIFCHGHGRNRGHVAAFLQTLHDLGLNVLAFDFRGHGDSAGHTSTFGHRETRDLLAAAAYVRRRFPQQPVLLMGVSLGAAVCLQALPQLPQVRGVWSEGAFARLGNAVQNEFAWVPGFLRGPLVRSYYLLGWLDCGLWGPSINPVDRLRGVAVPICFCHAKQDELVPFAEGQALYESYAGPKAHWWVAEASHYNVRQRNPQEYRRRLRAFLEDCLSRS